MIRCRVLPPIVGAEQFTHDQTPLGVIPHNDAKGGVLFQDQAKPGFRDTTPLLNGDWVIYWPDGRRSVCIESQFSKRYEAIP